MISDNLIGVPSFFLQGWDVRSGANGITIPCWKQQSVDETMPQILNILLQR